MGRNCATDKSTVWLGVNEVCKERAQFCSVESFVDEQTACSLDVDVRHVRPNGKTDEEIKE
jgi:hypothetical protein